MKTILSEKLQEFFNTTAMPKTVFAKRIGVTNTTIHNYITKGTRPSKEIAIEIGKQTNGFIRMEDMGYAD